MKPAGLLVTTLLALILSVSGEPDPPRGQPPPTSVAPGARPAVPVFAYYYIWFNPSTWDRPLHDFPSLGRYSSDDADVMRRHIRLAAAAGLTGFIVSWKGTEALDRRLAQLVELARAESFSLAVIYEALDARREPLPVERVQADLTAFRQRYGDDPVFGLLGSPVVIWSGTWRYSPPEVARVTDAVRGGLSVLASERDVEGYQRLADLVAGNAYYWSSVDPREHPGHAAKLREMGEAVHRHDGLWVAPFAPGFDARRVGGTSVVDRRDGATLRESYSAAVASSPDALGLISWNEFGEATHVEPSVNFGPRYVEVLADLTGSAASAAGDRALDSSRFAETTRANPYAVVAFALLGTMFLVAVGIRIARRVRGGG
ncbi:hypothetical protein ACFQE5_11620 [Pseudonocardia hispaniensis]|uniref:Glycosyl hydrolase family 71 n=1 Tax=Pseudonocardia hispaniensis TaxID=904933 RepID=A0ABW1J2K0_9PSEU